MLVDEVRTLEFLGLADDWAELTLHISYEDLARSPYSTNLRLRRNPEDLNIFGSPVDCEEAVLGG